MPIQYPLGAVEEHRLTRRSLGFFDTGHMGRLSVSGKGAGETLSGLVSARILDMRPNEARYALLLNDAGGVIDDLFIYREEGEDAWFVVVNAGNRETDVEYLGSRLSSGVTLRDISEETYMIALQGKRAVELMDRVSGGRVSPMPRFSMIRGELLGSVPGLSLRIGRTGYTGEDGVELFYDAGRARELWEHLLAQAGEAGIEAGPVGLAARDSLRFEAGMSLHGHEISPAISPLEGGLSWACDFEKDFVGKKALLAQKAAGLKRRLVTVNVTGGVPREGCPVLNGGGTEIGRCVSGMFCPSTGTYSANALLPPEYAGIGAKVTVLIREKPKEGVVVKRPLYIPVYRRRT
jgi:glycine cleavage system T protein